MTLEQLILGISTSWDTARCLLIAASPPRKRTPPLWPAPPPSPTPVCVFAHAQGHKLYSLYSRYICEATGKCIKTKTGCY